MSVQERGLQISSGVIAPVYIRAMKGGHSFAQFKSALKSALEKHDGRWINQQLDDKDIVTRLRGLERATAEQFKKAGKAPPEFKTLPGTPQAGPRGKRAVNLIDLFADITDDDDTETDESDDTETDESDESDDTETGAVAQ